jgi:hypothetical protein
MIDILRLRLRVNQAVPVEMAVPDDRASRFVKSYSSCAAKTCNPLLSAGAFSTVWKSLIHVRVVTKRIEKLLILLSVSDSSSEPLAGSEDRLDLQDDALSSAV